MSLTNRVSLFFLTALGLVLVGFSITLYFLADHYLHAQADHRLDTAMQTMIAAVEIHPGDVEWEPLERHISMGTDPDPDQLHWSVHDLNGKLIDCSPCLETQGKRMESGWHSLTRRIRAGSFQSEPLGNTSTSQSGPLLQDIPHGEIPGSVPLPPDRTYHGEGLVLTVAVAEAPVAAELRQLALAMASISALIWLTAAVWGRMLCRRALAPIAKMAISARSVSRTATDRSLLEVSSTRDELEDLGQAFNELLADLRLALERQHRFTGDASHQLRTPLTAMLASVEVALRHVRSPEEYQRVLNVVRRRGVQLRQIIESLLFLARAESVSPVECAETINLVEWCRNWLENWAEHPRAGDIRFEPNVSSSLVFTHPALLGQVLDNLLDNACKYSEPGRPIVVSIEPRRTEIVLCVADAGCGITAEDQLHICEPFFRSAQARTQGTQGVGLGLTVAQRLINLLGGRFEIESEPGKGSRFGLVLPFELDDHVQQDAEVGKLSHSGDRYINPESEIEIYMSRDDNADKSMSSDAMRQDGEGSV